MATFVLVPGSMCGGWLWQPLVPLLRVAGHDVYPVTLTGYGERAHLASAAVDLDTHITDLVNLLYFEDLQGVILVGHSAASMAIAGAADRIPERVRRLVYLDAAIARDGESYDDVWSIGPRPADPELEWQLPVPFPEDDAHRIFPDMAVEDIPWAYARLTPRLIKMMIQPIELTNPLLADIPRTYIFCTKNWEWDDLDNPLPADVLRARTDPEWDFRELDADHLPMFTRPGELADLLLTLA